jgi:phosphoadenosine phosphosulfate reductase
MLLDRELLHGDPVDRVAGLNLTWRNASAEDVIAGVASEFPGQVALVSSFGAEAAVLLGMVAEVDRDLPVLMVDTLMLFEETLDYRRWTRRLRGVRSVRRRHAGVHVEPRHGRRRRVR